MLCADIEQALRSYERVLGPSLESPQGDVFVWQKLRWSCPLDSGDERLFYGFDDLAGLQRPDGGLERRGGRFGHRPLWFGRVRDTPFWHAAIPVPVPQGYRYPRDRSRKVLAGDGW